MKFFDRWNVARRQFAIQSAASIFERCHRLKMVRVHATPHTAQVIKEKAVRNWTNTLFVVKTMGLKTASVDADLSVTVLINSQLPNPARSLVSSILNQIAHPLPHVVVVDKPHRMIFHDAQDEVALRGYRRLLTAAAEAKAGWIRWWNLNSARQAHNPLQVDGSGTPGESRYLTSVSKADAQPRFRDVDWILA